ncbi:MAG TPA: phage Gp37/Gp68 family protein [Rhizomicrobium sp.]|jgi:protein gp37|nr:phage Gp37/Gp68 family protein [Rhizomicrobium sp.]
MAAKSKIEWTDSTWKPIRARRLSTGKVGWHCVHMSEGCRNCYAERQNKNTFYGNGLAYKPGHEMDIEIFLDEKTLTAPLRWKNPRQIFVCSMTDLFADFVKDEWIDRIFAVMALCPQHTFQILTKRPERMRAYLTEARAKFAGEMLGTYEMIVSAAMGKLGLGPGQFRETFPNGMPWPLPNVWLGTSCEDQATANARSGPLFDTPAAVRFFSLEPLLGPIDMHLGEDLSLTPDWVIVGGESGPNARPMHPDWARSLRDQCAAAGVPFFFKQWGEWQHETQIGAAMVSLAQVWAATLHPWPDDTGSMRLGKKTAGRLLDGAEHNAYPEASP